MTAGELPAQPPPEVVAYAKRHAASEERERDGRATPSIRADESPWLAVQRAILATWKAARVYAAGEVLPPPPTLFRAKRCGGCWAELWLVPTEASGGTETIPVEARPDRLAGNVRIVPSPAGPVARVYGDATEAQVCGGDRYRPHFDNCKPVGDARPPARRTRTKRNA